MTARASPPAVVTARLTKEFASGVGVIDLDLDVPSGTVYGFLGPNGAGKTTTLRMLVGTLRPDRGRALVVGLDPARDEVAIKRQIGVLPSDPSFPLHHDGAHLVRLIGRLRGEADAVVGRARDLAERLDLDLERPAGELSLGNRQKLGVVLALAHQPVLAILDEPSSGLDPLMQREVDGLLREMAARGGTVLLSSHSLAEVERVADHVGFIRAGRLIEQAPLTELAARAVRRASFTFATRVPPDAFTRVPGVPDVAGADQRAGVTVTWQGPAAPVLHRAGELGALTVEARGADLEATFLALYGGGRAVGS